MLAKHIAEIHGKKLLHVNEAINENRKRFKDGVDLIDVKQIGATDTFLETGVLTKAQIGNAKNIYLLSERGYAKLIKIFNDDKSWELYDQLLDEYFDLREANNNTTPMPMSQAEMLVMYAQQFVEQEKRMAKLEQQTEQTNNDVSQIKKQLTQVPDFKTLQHAVVKHARNVGIHESEAWAKIYTLIGDQYGVNLGQVVSNRHKKINEERVAAGKKPYKESTLKTKYNKRMALEEKGLMQEAMNIIAGLN